jgi:AcrR family transcriptional regulator
MTQPSSNADRLGTRTRAGNNMSRARAGILSGAAQSIVRFGTRKTTMADIARAGGVAKATLYNHFRDKQEVYAALLAAEVAEILARMANAHEKASAEAGTAAGPVPLAAALTTAATALSNHAVLRRLAESEPATLAPLLRPSDGATWERVRGYADELVRAAVPDADPPPDAEVALRWVLSHVTWSTESPPAPAAQQIAAALVAAADTPRAGAGPQPIEARSDVDMPDRA